MSAPELGALLVEHRGTVAAYVRRHAGRLLRYESLDDLAQAVHLRALDRGAAFRWNGDGQFVAWLHAVARTCLADRQAYWAALRRRPARLVRLGMSQSGSDDGGGARRGGLAASSAGPSTVASRREQLAIAVRAMAALLPRDRDLVQWTCEDVPPDEQALRLGATREAADRARRRALERFRKAFELASRA